MDNELLSVSFIEKMLFGLFEWIKANTLSETWSNNLICVFSLSWN